MLWINVPACDIILNAVDQNVVGITMKSLTVTLSISQNTLAEFAANREYVDNWHFARFITVLKLPGLL